MKKLILLLAVMLLLTGCGAEATPATETAAPAVAETALPAEAEETTESTEPTVNVNELLTNVWDILDNEAVEEIPLLPGLEMDDVQIWQETTRYQEIKLYQRTRVETIRMGQIGDVVVAQYAMDTDDPSLLWNVRMEPAESLDHKTGIQVPEDAEVGQWENLDPAVPMRFHIWSNGDGTTTSMYTAYFADTGNLYTFYCNQLIYKYDADGKLTYCNNGRIPTATLNNIDDGAGYYRLDQQAAKKANDPTDIRYFRIRMGEELVTYQYVFGMTVAEWVKSPYNTDGWHFPEDRDSVIVSADESYKLLSSPFCWRTMKASVYNPSENE